MEKPTSLLPAAGENKFQRIKRICAEAVANGTKLIKLSIGQPSGPAILEARQAASRAVLSDEECMHEYQDNGSPGVPGFAERFVQCHVRTPDIAELVKQGEISCLPIPGIKPMLGIVMQSLGSWLPERIGVKESMVLMMTNPGYPTPADQAQMIRGINHASISIDETNFLFPTSGWDLGRGDLIMLNRPHNPAGVVGVEQWLKDLCTFCQEKGIRIFNDAAYAILTHTDRAVTLADIAINFPYLSWAEAFSASKAGNMTGWRNGAMVGSPDFIGDIARIKGNTDSGFVAPMAAGVIELFEKHLDKIKAYQLLYATRLEDLIYELQQAGMKLAVRPEAGFFALFQCPKKAFGQDIKDADQFNQLMIKNTGVVGVDFGQYIRYAICAAPVEELIGEIRAAFDKAEVSY